MKKLPPDKFEKYQKFLTSYKTTKTSINSIIKDQSTLETINDIVQRMNRIVQHTYHFLKLFLITINQETLDLSF